jgi:twinkle protein
MLKAHHLQVLEGRGLDAELLVKHGVESCDRPGEWVSIPYVLGGQIVNHKYRTVVGEKKFSQDAGAVKCFWNHDVLSDETLSSQPLIITEGEWDALAAIQCGFVRTMSVPDGAPAEALGDKMDGQKYSYVTDAQALLRDVREIILATDSDGPGVHLMNDLAIRLGKARCKWVRYPKGCKDLNDALMQYGHKGVVESINRAQWVQVDGVYRMSHLPPAPDRQVHRIGIPVLDNHYRIRPMDFCVVTGIPSHGKSAVLTDIAGHMVQNNGWPVAIASFEQQPQVDLRRNLRTWYNRKRVIDQNEIELARADSWIDKNFCFIAPNDDDEVTLAWVMERLATAVIRFGAKLIIVDPWNEMDHVRPPDMTLTEYTGFAIKEFKRFARKYQVHVIVAAHPAKQRPTEAGGFSIPTLYDISDSAHWYNKPDVGLVVWRGKDKFGNDLSIIRVAKSRYHDQIGTPGDVQVTFDTHTNRFTPTDTSMARAVNDD